MQYISRPIEFKSIKEIPQESRPREKMRNLNGQERKMVVGLISALGRQIDYFLEDDLKTYSEKLRRTN